MIVVYKRLKERKEISHILNLKVKPRARLLQNNINAKYIWVFSSIFWLVQGMKDKIKNKRNKFSAFQNQLYLKDRAFLHNENYINR